MNFKYRLVMGSWALVALVLSMAYCSTLISFITAPNYVPLAKKYCLQNEDICPTITRQFDPHIASKTFCPNITETTAMSCNFRTPIVLLFPVTLSSPQDIFSSYVKAKDNLMIRGSAPFSLIRGLPPFT